MHTAQHTHEARAHAQARARACATHLLSRLGLLGVFCVCINAYDGTLSNHHTGIVATSAGRVLQRRIDLCSSNEELGRKLRF
jgi:hypothetical protein